MLLISFAVGGALLLDLICNTRMSGAPAQAWWWWPSSSSELVGRLAVLAWSCSDRRLGRSAVAELGRWQRQSSVWIPGRRPWRVEAGEARASRGGMAWCSPCLRRICDGDLLWIGSDQRRRRARGILLCGSRGLVRRGGSPPPRLQWWHTQAVAGAPGVPRWHCCCGWSPDLGGWI